MLSLAYTCMVAAKVLIFFFVLYIFLPSRVIRFEEDDGLLDKFFISLTHMVALTIVIVHILAFLKLYETFSLIGSYFLFYVALAWWRGRSPAKVADTLGMKVVAGLLNMSEGRGGIKEGIREYIRSRKEKVLAGLVAGSHRFIRPFEGFLPLAVLGYAAYLRFDHSFRHAYFGASDCYVHLAWVKYLGSNQIYRDGIYPYGYHAVASALEKITLVDPYFILRFLGPLAGALMVLSVYYAALKVTCNYPASFLAVFVYGAIDKGLPSDLGRQISALPQEFAAVFLPLSLYFLVCYLGKDKKIYVALFGECLAISFWVHTYASVYIIIGAGVITLGSMFFRFLNKSKLLYIVATGISATILGILPLGMGLALGKTINLEYIEKNITTGGALQRVGIDLSGGFSLKNFWTNNYLLDLFFYMCLLEIILVLLFLIFKGNEKMKTYWPPFSFATVAFLMYFLYWAKTFGLPTLMDISRTGQFFSTIAPTVYAVGLAGISNLFLLKRIRDLMIPAVVLSLIVFFFLAYPTSPPRGGCWEYDEAVESYIKIRQTYPALDWTIISPVEQYSQVMGKGWHYEIWEFVNDFSLEQAQNPHFDLPIPTTYIFLFIEKKPLGLEREIMPQDLLFKLDPPGNNPTNQYYRNLQARAAIQARALAWAGAYLKSHDNISVFFENDNMRVYLIKHKPLIKNTT